MSNIAALFLLGLFVLETSVFTTSPRRKTNVPDHFSYPLTEINVKEDITVIEINDFLREKRERQRIRKYFYKSVADLD